MDIAIFGAQGYALGAHKAIKELYPRRAASFFIVSETGGNAATLGGLPVRNVADVSAELTEEQKDNLEVIIATPENVQPDIEEILEDYGFRHYIRLDSDRWGELMKLYHMKLGRFLPLSALPMGCSKPFVKVYMAKSDKDRPLINAMKIPEYMYPLQVGAKQAKIRISDRTDDTGENISGKNGNYSELTGLYWVWKNKLLRGDVDDGQYYGLAQYRRMLFFSDDDLLRLYDNDVDAVLPYPLMYEPDIEAHHKRWLRDADWDAMLMALKELQPEYADYFSQVLGQEYLYNYNIILTKKSVLRDYCEWLFPILERAEELSVPKGSDRSDRYIGYMGETLETLYFMKNRDRLNISHAGCMMLT